MPTQPSVMQSAVIEAKLQNHTLRLAFKTPPMSSAEYWTLFSQAVGEILGTSGSFPKNRYERRILLHFRPSWLSLWYDWDRVLVDAAPRAGVPGSVSPPRNPSQPTSKPSSRHQERPQFLTPGGPMVILHASLIIDAGPSGRVGVPLAFVESTRWCLPESLTVLADPVVQASLQRALDEILSALTPAQSTAR